MIRVIGGRSLRLPDFLGIGPPRTATTWLEQVLRGRVGLPEGIKETQFFLVWRYQLGLKWYAAHFRKCRPDLPVGEFGPLYFDSPEARDRIARDLPECRIICTLRDPVERLYSHYRLWRRGYTKSPFEHAAFKHRQLLDTTRYADHLQGWLDRFGRERVLVLLNDDLNADQQGYIDRVCDFIGIGRFDVSSTELANRRVHAVERAPRSFRAARRAQYVKRKLHRRRLYRLAKLIDPLFEYCLTGGAPYPPLDPELAARIRASLRPQIEALEKLIDRDLSAWKYQAG